MASLASSLFFKIKFSAYIFVATHHCFRYAELLVYPVQDPAVAAGLVPLAALVRLLQHQQLQQQHQLRPHQVFLEACALVVY